jgi:hypothetical protein
MKRMAEGQPNRAGLRFGFRGIYYDLGAILRQLAKAVQKPRLLIKAHQGLSVHGYLIK